MEEKFLAMNFVDHFMNVWMDMKDAQIILVD